ncbi:MAG TPA: hypothetical protein PKD10_07305 [Paracoccaceae bacterium]|nr:hypothetical protein [Paracoccaceae bacterium]HMO70496.1 hypothetical protein [Paracoccaceae bacterium]
MRAILISGLLALGTFAGPTTVSAGPIEAACMASDRRAASRALCGCIQQAADMTLRGGDQRKAARFFRDPDQAQQVRMSKSDSDNAFWARYKAFGATAETLCTNG